MAHEPDMKIPIINSLYEDGDIKFKTKDINFKILNDLALGTIDSNFH